MSEPWQNGLNTWKSRISYLHGQKYMSDCCFILDNTNIKIPAHKFVLATCSKTFYYLFFITKNLNEITVRNVSLEALESFVYFLYNETTTLRLETLWDVLKLAKIYSVKSLERFCDDFLLKIINLENIFDHLEKLSKFNLPKSKAKIRNFINTKHVSFETLEKIVILKCFPGNEGDIYRAINKWAEECCKTYDCTITSENKRFFLGENFDKCLKLIKFERMSVKELNEFTLGRDSMLTSDEINEIHKNLLNKNVLRKKVTTITSSRLNEMFSEVNQIIEEDSDNLNTATIPSGAIKSTLVPAAELEMIKIPNFAKEIENSAIKNTFANSSSIEGFSEAKKIIRECLDIVKRRNQASFNKKTGTTTRPKEFFSKIDKIIEECPTTKPEEIEMIPKEYISENNLFTEMKAPLSSLEPITNKNELNSKNRKLTLKNECVLKIESTSKNITIEHNTSQINVQFHKKISKPIKNEKFITPIKPKQITRSICQTEDAVNIISACGLSAVKKEILLEQILSDFESPCRNFAYKGCGCRVSCSGNCGCFKSGCVWSPSCFCRGDCSSLSRPSPQSLFKMGISSNYLLDINNLERIGNLSLPNRRCSCKVSCSGNCGCYKSGSVCSTSCFCRGDCPSLSRPSPQSLIKMGVRSNHLPNMYNVGPKSIGSSSMLYNICGCLESCTANCGCFRKGIACTSSCLCRGNCSSIADRLRQFL